jgi:hypothetical protein
MDMGKLLSHSLSKVNALRPANLVWRKRGLTVLSAVLIALLFSTVSVTNAAGPSWTVVSLNTTGCNAGNIGFTTRVSGITSFPTTLHFRTIVDAGGIRYMDEDAGTPGANGDYGWHLYYSNSGGPATNAWPIPNDTPITVQFLLINGAGGPTVTSQVITLSKCNGGTIVANPTAGGAFFAPGDGRVDPRPGDRLAVYCNTTFTPPSVSVWGIADNLPDAKKGIFLATFNLPDLLKAGNRGITKNAGANLGSVSLADDGQGHFYAAWNGGKYNANGLRDFSKSFTCAFPG